MNSGVVGLAQARDALAQASRDPLEGRLETSVFEPFGAAAGFCALAGPEAGYLLLVDIGAGTMDFAGFEVLEGAEHSVNEIEACRQTTGLAGDEIDRLLMQAILSKRREAKDVQVEKAVWRTLRLASPALKHEIFSAGKGRIVLDGKTIALKMADFVSDPHFRAFLEAMSEAITASLRPLADAVRNKGAPLTIVLAGGGASLPFFPLLLEGGGAKLGLDVKPRIIRLGEATPTFEDCDNQIAEVLSQLIIAMGGAIADVRLEDKMEGS